MKTPGAAAMRKQSPADLSGEIKMLRTSAAQVFAMADGIDDLSDAIAALGALGLAATRLERLLKAQSQLGSASQEDIAATLARALADVVDELGVAKAG
jgi:hypothetical protein